MSMILGSQTQVGTIIGDVVRKARIESTDSTSLAAIVTDANRACEIVASWRNWDELYKTFTISLTAADGDKNYPLNLLVDKIERCAITLPVDYAKPLQYVTRRALLDTIPAKTNNGTGTPNAYYYSIPTVSDNNVETKNISFDLMPDQAYTVAYTCRSYPPSLANVNDQPFFDGNYHNMVVDFCIWCYAQRNPDSMMNPDSWEAKWLMGQESLLAYYMSKVTINVPIPGPTIRRGN